MHGLRRLSQSVIKNGTAPIATTAYTYRDVSDTATTLQVESKRTSAYNRDVTYTYQYDANGNITSVQTSWYNPLIRDGDDVYTQTLNFPTVDTSTYVYDSQNQLLRENNELAGKTWVWEYDTVGNILSRTEYAYTTDTLGEPLDTVSYTYGDSEWGDLLTAYDGDTITYDAIGNPLSDGTWVYAWENGRQLASMSAGETTWEFEYNAGGLRKSRSCGDTTYEYIYSGDKLVQMTVGENTLYFTYDTSGYPETVTYNGDLFYYVTNLQGDVLWMLDSIGRAVISYNYDAWGNVIAVDGINNTLAELNPLRYRGYVYDTETGLYYLQSRYYNPETGSFMLWHINIHIQKPHSVLRNPAVRFRDPQNGKMPCRMDVRGSSES